MNLKNPFKWRHFEKGLCCKKSIVLKKGFDWTPVVYSAKTYQQASRDLYACSKLQIRDIPGSASKRENWRSAIPVLYAMEQGCIHPTIPSKSSQPEIDKYVVECIFKAKSQKDNKQHNRKDAIEEFGKNYPGLSFEKTAILYDLKRLFKSSLPT